MATGSSPSKARRPYQLAGRQGRPHRFTLLVASRVFTSPVSLMRYALLDTRSTIPLGRRAAAQAIEPPGLIVSLACISPVCSFALSRAAPPVFSSTSQLTSSSVVAELVRLPVPRPSGRRQMAQNCKGGTPFAYGRRALPHVDGHAGPPHFYTVRLNVFDGLWPLYAEQKAMNDCR